MKHGDLFLIIKTDSYTGNFERELLAYVFGLDDDEYGPKKLIDMFKHDDPDDYGDWFLSVFDTGYFGRWDSEYHCSEIMSHPTNDEYDCNSLLIALNEKLPDELYTYMLQRLDMFCEYMKTERWPKDIKILDVGYYRMNLERV